MKQFATKMVVFLVTATVLLSAASLQANCTSVLLNDWSEITNYSGNNNRPHHFYTNWYQNATTDNAQFQVWPPTWNGDDNIAVFRKSNTADLVYRNLTGSETIDVMETKTFFFRFKAADEKANQSIGLTGVTTPTGDNSFRLQLINRHGQFGVRHGGSEYFTDIDTGLENNPLYNVWVVTDNATDTFKVYMNQNDLNAGGAGATEADRLILGGIDTFDFRSPQAAATSRLMIHAFDGLDFEGKVWYDDLYMLGGECLANPVPEPATLVILGLGSLILRKRKS